MKITVSRDDIQKGQRRDPEDCPVARALRRAGVTHSGVMGAAITFTDLQQHTTLLLLPGEVQEWIARFDQGAEAAPFEFELAVPITGATRPRLVEQPEPEPDPEPEFAESDSAADETWTDKTEELELVEA